MASRITDRAVIIAKGTIKKNSVPYTVWADYQVGQRVRTSYPNRYWLVLETKERTITQSTQKQALFEEWMTLIAANGIAAQ